MRKFTFKMRAFFCALFAMVGFATAQAEVTKIADLFGSYTFTATVTVEDAGQAYADKFKGNCEVTISSHSLWDLEIVGVGGGTAGQWVYPIDFATHNFTVKMPNGDTYQGGSLWGDRIYMGDGFGNSPFGTNSYMPVWTFNPDTKEITIPNFTAVTLDANFETTAVLARFTGCKLTFNEGVDVVLEDLSGDYTFKAIGMPAEAEFPATFDMNLAATNEAFNAYTATMTFEGYDPVVFEDVTFDGVELSLPYNETYIDAEKTILFVEYNTAARQGTYKFKKGSGTSLSLSNGMRIVQKTVVEGVETPEDIQYYPDGTLVKQVEKIDFNGVYKVKAKDFESFTKEGDEWPAFEAEFEFELAQPYLEYFGEDTYNVMWFMQKNEQDITQGYFTGTAKGRTLELVVDQKIRSLIPGQLSDKIYDGQGTTTGKVALTINEDGTISMGEFFVFRVDATTPDAEPEMVAYYGGLEVTKVTEEEPEPEPVKVDFNGIYTVKVEGQFAPWPFIENDEYEYPTEFEFEIGQPYLDYYGENVYNIVSFNGDKAALSNGNFMATANGNVLEFPVSYGNGTPMTLFKRFSGSIEDGAYYLSVNEVLYDANATQEGTLTLTLNEDGTATLSSFHMFRKTRKDMNTSPWDVLVNEAVKGAYYDKTNMTVVKLEGGETSVDVVEKAETVSIYTQGGVIYVGNGMPVQVEVYNMAAQPVFRGVASQVEGLAKGLYIVKCGETVVKVIL